MTTPQPPTTVRAALLRVVETARALKHEEWHDAPMAKSWELVCDLEDAIAQFDALSAVPVVGVCLDDGIAHLGARAALNAEAVGGSEPPADYRVISNLRAEIAGHDCAAGCDSPHAVNCNCQGRCDFHKRPSSPSEVRLCDHGKPDCRCSMAKRLRIQQPSDLEKWGTPDSK